MFFSKKIVFSSIHSAGDGAEGRSNRQLNFQHSVTKLTIPRDFFQRIGSAGRAAPEPSDEEGLKRNESSASLDALPSKVVG